MTSRPSPRLAPLVVAVTLACAAERREEPPPAPATTPAPATPPAPTAEAPAAPDLIFTYAGSDCEHGLALTLSRDGAWERLEHSGWATPAGRLDARALAHFVALVRAAPFAATPGAPCEAICVSQATYFDRLGDRKVRGTYPCGDKVDPATERLPGCLELLFDDPEAAYRSCPLPE